jgi:hypothetical protein
MAEHDHTDVANDAISVTIKDQRPSVTGSWMTLVPENAPLNFASQQAWMGFLGAIIERYRGSIKPCRCPGAAVFATYSSEQLIQLRDALVEATICN